MNINNQKSNDFTNEWVSGTSQYPLSSITNFYWHNWHFPSFTIEQFGKPFTQLSVFWSKEKPSLHYIQKVSSEHIWQF